MHKPLMTFGLLVTTALFAACGSDGGDCESAGKALCQAACDCTAGDACAIGAGTSSSGFSLTFDSQADCEALYLAACAVDDGTSPVDFAQCESDLSSAMCVDAGGTMALASPASCEEE